jgi:hypothetical protein
MNSAHSAARLAATGREKRCQDLGQQTDDASPSAIGKSFPMARQKSRSRAVGVAIALIIKHLPPA